MSLWSEVLSENLSKLAEEEPFDHADGCGLQPLCVYCKRPTWMDDTDHKYDCPWAFIYCNLEYFQRKLAEV